MPFLSSLRIKNGDRKEVNLKKHIELLGILHIVFHSLGLIIAIVVLLLLGGGLIMSCERTLVRGFDTVITIYRILAIGVLSLVSLLSIVGIIGGIGLLKMRPWGRILALIVGFISLIRIPLGTALGIYTIWVLMNDETIKLFREAGMAQVSVGTS